MVERIKRELRFRDEANFQAVANNMVRLRGRDRLAQAETNIVVPASCAQAVPQF